MASRDRGIVSTNSLEHLCDLLIPWDILSPTAQDTRRIEKIPCLFPTASCYIQSWLPLVIEEIKASILSNLVANTKPSHRSGGMASVMVSDQTEVSRRSPTLRLVCEFVPSTNSPLGATNYSTATIRSTKGRDDERREMPAVMDLILLANKRIPSPLTIPTCEKVDSEFIWTLGIIVSNSRPDGSRGYQVKVHRSKFLKLMLEVSTKEKCGKNTEVDFDECDLNMIPKSYRFKAISLHYLVLDSLTSSWREFLAIHDIHVTSPMFAHVLANQIRTDTSSGVVNRLLETASSPFQFSLSGLSGKYKEMFASKFNSSQLNAIQTSATKEGFTLIQGPPGSGKTTTIIGILNSIHIREYNKYYELAIDALLGDDGLKCRQSNDSDLWLKLINRLGKSKPHVLVAAPSNVAVDNIISRILETRFIDGTGSSYKPNILRVGGGKSAKVNVVSLEETVEQELSSGMSEAQIRTGLDNINAQLIPEIRKLIQLQTYLINLKTAFLNHPLPPGWELRIALDTSLPYWVDHVNKSASNSPPPSVGLAKSKIFHDVVDGEVVNGRKSSIVRIVNGEFTLKSLPEYVIHTNSLTRVLDNIDRLNTLLNRQKLHGRSHEFNNVLARRQALECSIIDEAHLVFSTLNSAGHPSLESTEFCVAIVDEAAQCVEPSLLIALRRGCKKCIMVGDPMQLPATIFADNIRRVGYDRSLFERLTQAGHPVILLDRQYRMVPIISRFPSTIFYDNKLQDGSNVKRLDYCPKYLDTIPAFLRENSKEEDNGFEPPSNSVLTIPSMVFFNLIQSRDLKSNHLIKNLDKNHTETSTDHTSSNSSSRKNPEEATFCVNLVEALLALAENAGLTLGSIGVITPYTEQLAELRRCFTKVGLIVGATQQRPSDTNTSTASLGKSNQSYDIELNTVDGFQGQEKNIIIISTVRSNEQGNIGFLSDPRRLNVAITRAKFGLFIVGNAATLSSNHYWNELICYSETIGAMWNVASATENVSKIIKSHFMNKSSRDYSINQPTYGIRATDSRTDRKDVQLINSCPDDYIVPFCDEFDQSLPSTTISTYNIQSPNIEKSCKRQKIIQEELEDGEEIEEL